MSVEGYNCSAITEQVAGKLGVLFMAVCPNVQYAYFVYCPITFP